MFLCCCSACALKRDAYLAPASPPSRTEKFVFTASFNNKGWQGEPHSKNGLGSLTVQDRARICPGLLVLPKMLCVKYNARVHAGATLCTFTPARSVRLLVITLLVPEHSL